MSSGYSGTPVFKKLGLKPGVKLLVMNAPPGYRNLVQMEAPLHFCGPAEQPDIVHLFAGSYQQFLDGMLHLKKIVYPKITIWVSWHKKTSKIKTDLNEDLIRNFGLENGLVDVKVCAIDENWSALKLVVPLSRR